MELSLPLPQSDRPRRWFVPAMLVGLLAAAAVCLLLSKEPEPPAMHMMPVMAPMTLAISGGLAVATFVSEDLALIAAGEGVRRGSLDWLPAIVGCLLGIWVGDMALWFVGRLSARRALSWSFINKRINERKLDDFRTWFERRSVVAILVARFVPGLRFPTFIAAGATGRGGLRFAGWTFLAAAVWTPLLIGLVVVVGDLIAEPLRRALGYAWLTLPAGIVLLYAGFRLAGQLSDPLKRARLAARVQRLWRWEFWPAWLFYIPVALYITAKSLRRGGFAGFASITAANPGMPDGGFVGESKRQILASLPQEHVIPFLHCPVASATADEDRTQALVSAMQLRGWNFPVIVKPDVGQRGVGVARCNDLSELRRSIERSNVDLIVQPYHPGPYEVGIFYVRLPSEQKGRIFSMTEKVFPMVTGDGRSTLRELIWNHPRYRMQADLFLARFAGDVDQVLSADQSLTLSVAGNHCQGTLFRDGGHLRTEALEAKIDQIARGFDGFYFGRFDIRYCDPVAFARGEDLAIVELNGVTSESTNVYDPAGTLIGAWMTFIRQWRWLFAIADMNIARGHRPTPWRALSQSVRKPRG